MTRNTIILATQLPNENFDIFLPLILRLWKITCVCDIFFLKKLLVYFLRVFLVEQAEFDKNIFLATQLPNKNFDFFAHDIATMEDNLRV